LRLRSLVAAPQRGIDHWSPPLISMPGNTPIPYAPEPPVLPPGFALLHGADGHLFLACTDDLASSYAIRLVGDDRHDIARRVPADAASALAELPSGAVAWQLGITPRDRAQCRIVVHRPFGTILMF
jgi:hypothetical protein